MAAPQARKGAQPADVAYEIAEEDEYYVTRPHTSVRRYRQPVQRDTLDDYTPGQTAFIQRRRASGGTPVSKATKAVTPPLVLPLTRSHRKTPWLALALGMLLTLGLVLGFHSLGSWWQLHQDDTTYGMPRTYQTNAVVGHQDSANKPSHFLFMNMNGHVIVLEFPGGDATHSLVYTGPTLFGNDGDLIPVTGEFRDVNGDGLPDMLIHVQDQTIVFLNTGSKFRPLQPGEHVTI